jgi:hypothetical protein
LSLHKTTALKQKTLPACLGYAKDFEVIIDDFRHSEQQSGVYYNIDLNDGYAAFVARALKAMPNLRSLRFFFLCQFFCHQLINVLPQLAQKILRRRLRLLSDTQ